MQRGDLARSALDPSEFPTGNLQEVALLGRSNAGKSSLLNALLNRRAARVSGTPGQTRRIHFYWVKNWYLVDLPGFGYAALNPKERLRFGRAVDDYLNQRAQLTAAILIQDIRRDPAGEEQQLVEWARRRNVLLLVAANKADKLNRTATVERVAALNAAYGFEVLPVSARTGAGLDALKERLRGLGLEGL
jgi:GTP-binding protein